MITKEWVIFLILIFTVWNYDIWEAAAFSSEQFMFTQDKSTENWTPSGKLNTEEYGSNSVKKD